MAFYETMMVRGYESLVDPDTTVDVNTGMLAAGRLQAMVDSRAGETSLAEIVVKMNRVIEAVRSTVPPECRTRSATPRSVGTQWSTSWTNWPR